MRQQRRGYMWTPNVGLSGLLFRFRIGVHLAAVYSFVHPARFTNQFHPNIVCSDAFQWASVSSELLFLRKIHDDRFLRNICTQFFPGALRFAGVR